MASKFNDSDWLPLNIRRGRDINEALAGELTKASITELHPDLSKPKWMLKAIRSLYLDHFKPVYLIFDQFEELMIFGSKTEKQQFVQSVKAVVDSDLQCRFIFVIREEYLAGITEFERIVPEILENRVRIEKMGFENARQAIEGPCRVARIGVEEGFAENMLSRLSPGSGDIELTYLQVFLDRLYKMASAENQEAENTIHFTNALIDNCGNVKDLLGTFLDEQIKSFADSEMAMTVLKAMVSVKGTKKQVGEAEISDFCHSMGKPVDAEILRSLLNQFVNLRILRDKDNYNRYELRHDALAEKIYENISIAEKELFEVQQFVENAYELYLRRGVLLSKSDLNYLAPYSDKLYLSREHETFIKRSQSELTKARRRRIWILSSAAIVLLIVLSGFTWWAMRERSKAEENEKKALANYYNSLAKGVVNENPTVALRLAEYAYSIDTANKEILENIYSIYYSNNLYKTIYGVNTGISCVKKHPQKDVLFLGMVDGSMHVVDTSGNLVAKYDTIHNRVITEICFYDDNTIITASFDCTAKVWDSSMNLIAVLAPDRTGTADYIGLKRCIAVSPDRQKIVISVARHSFQIYDRNWTLLVDKDAHNENIADLKFLDNENVFITCSDDKTAKFWDTNGNCINTVEFNDNVSGFVQIGKTLLFRTSNAILEYDSEGNFIDKIQTNSSEYAKLWRINDLMIYTEDNNIYSYLASYGQSEFLSSFLGHKHIVLDVEVIGSYLFSASFDGSLKRWNMEQQLLQSFTVPANAKSDAIYTGNAISNNYCDGGRNQITHLSFINNDESLFICSRDSISKIVDLTTGRETLLIGHKRGINDAVVSYDGKFMLTSSSDSTVRLWGLNGENILTIKTECQYITNIDLSRDNKRIAVCDNKRCIYIYNRGGELIRKVEKDEIPGTIIQAVKLLDNNQIIAIDAMKGVILLLDSVGNELKRYQGKGSIYYPFETFIKEDKKQKLYYSSLGGSNLYVFDSLLNVKLIIPGYENEVADAAINSVFSIFTAGGFKNMNLEMYDKVGLKKCSLIFRNSLANIDVSQNGKLLSVGFYGFNKVLLFSLKSDYKYPLSENCADVLSLSNKMQYEIVFDFQQSITTASELELNELFFYLKRNCDLTIDSVSKADYLIKASLVSSELIKKNPEKLHFVFRKLISDIELIKYDVEVDPIEWGFYHMKIIKSNNFWDKYELLTLYNENLEVFYDSEIHPEYLLVSLLEAIENSTEFDESMSFFVMILNLFMDENITKMVNVKYLFQVNQFILKHNPLNKAALAKKPVIYLLQNKYFMAMKWYAKYNNEMYDEKRTFQSVFIQDIENLQEKGIYHIGYATTLELLRTDKK
ncbi:MAG TPA: hypothetical protein PLZ52_01705 [Bacteroidales bacterium]|nr:hypothetical protein [Bacteroidales bacterium]